MSDLLMIEPTTMQVIDSGWEIDAECPIIMRSIRAHDIEEYREQLGRLDTIGGAVQFWIGDVVNDLRDRYGYGEMEDLAKELDRPLRTIQTFAYISKQTITTRVVIYPEYPELTHRHYMVVAPLEEDEQIHWLKKAGKDELSASELRKTIKGLDWEPRYFNHWSAFPIESWQQEYPGQIPGGILQNVLYYTTQRGDLVIDAFGGGGNMGKACERMERRCIAYDIDPQFPNITKHNVVFPFPDSGANLVFLDPPYWGQKQGEYATDPADLSNIEDASQFHALLKAVFDNAKQALLPGGYCVLIIGASQTKDYYIDHAAEMYCLVKDEWRHVNSIAAAYPTTQYSGNDMNNAKKNHMMLNLYTTIQIWQKR